MQEELTNKNRIEFDYDNAIFRKYLSTDKFEAELEMTRFANSLSSSSDLFNTPILKNYDIQNFILEFELIQNARTLREYFVSTAGWGISSKNKETINNIFFRLGQSISELHNSNVNSYNGSIRKIPDTYLSNIKNEDCVLIHGDFTLSNVLYSEKLDKINIIDWSISPILNFTANYGPRYWDISFLISSLFNTSYSTFFSFEIRTQLVKSFLSGYLDNSNIKSNAFLLNLAQYLEKYNYYNLYAEYYRKTKNQSNLFLISNTKSNLRKLISLLPSLIDSSD